MATETKSSNSLLTELPVDRLKDEAMNLGKALAKHGASKLGERLTGTPGKGGGLSDLLPGPGDMVKGVAKAASPVKPVKEAASKVKDALPGGGGSDDEELKGGKSGGGKPQGDSTSLKVTNIVESIDVPVSRDVAYELWTQFEEFPSFMKKVEAVNQKDPEVVTWKAQIFWSHRTWTAKIVDQVPPERIVWKSEAEKGKVDGAVTFHELAPDLTRVLVSLEYHPQGLFERTGNIWRAQGRRVRLELKHFRRHVANHALLNQDDIEGWGGEIHDGKVQRRRKSSGNGSGSGSGAKKSGGNGSTPKKSSSNGSTAKKSSSSGSTAKKSSSSGSAAKKSASSNGSTAKKSSSSGPSRASSSSSPSARKSTGSNGSPAKKASSSGSTAKKSSSAPAKKSSSSSSSRPAAKKSTGSPARKSSSRPAAKKSSGSPARKSTPQRTAAAAKKSTTTTKRTSPARKRTPAKKTAGSSRSRS